MDGLLLHPVTKKSVEDYLKQPGVPIILLGGEGAGKLFLARILAAEALGVKNLDTYAYFLQIARPEDKQNILIDQIRGAKRFLKLKTTGNGVIRRAIIIAGAQDMNIEAQNALLKTLEEPNSDSAFILTASSASSVLPTIASRAQAIEVKPVNLAAAASFFNEYPKSDIVQAWNLSQGNVGLMSSLLVSSSEHPLKASVDQAKMILRLNRYERQIELSKMTKDRPSFKQFLSAMSLLLAALHHGAIAKNNSGLARKLLSDRKLVQKLDGYLESNISLKLAADELGLKLKV